MTSNTVIETRTEGVKFGKALRKEFLLDEKWRNLNHGSVGTFPRPIRNTLRHYQDTCESRPDAFILYTYPPLYNASRAALSNLLNAPLNTLVLMPNASTGINTVLRNLRYAPGDKILYISVVYDAVHKTIEYITETTEAGSVCVEFTLPIEDDELVALFRGKIVEEQGKGNRVKCAVFDTVVSMPGVRLPFEQLIEVCRELGVLSVVDGAHGVGHVELDLGKLDPDFFVSNCHKWLFVPRACAVFYVPLRNQHLMRSTLPTSHGFVPLPRPGLKFSNPIPAINSNSAFEQNFEFVGTLDNSPYLCIPAALKWRESIGGEKAIMQYNHKLAKDAAYRAAEILGTEVLDNKTETLTKCCLTNTRLPLELREVEAVAAEAGMGKEDVGAVVRGWMVKTLVEEYDTFMALKFYEGQWWVRWSAQVYLELEDFEWGARTLKELCARVMKGEFAAVKSKL